MKKIIITVIIFLCLAAGGYYFHVNTDQSLFDSERFPANTYINGVNCSGMTIEEAESELTSEWNSNSLTFTCAQHTLGSISMSGISYDISEQLKDIRKNYYLSTVMNDILGTRLNVSVDMKVNEYGNTFDEAMESALFLKKNIYTGKIDTTPTQDAYIDLDDPELAIIKEVYGTSIDYSRLKDFLSNLIAEGTFSVHYISSDFYVQPSITAESEELLDRQRFYKEYLTSNVSYTLGKDTVFITPSEMASFRGLKLKKSGALTKKEINDIKNAVSNNILIEEAVSEYVYEFANKYNTMYSTREFVTSTGKTVTVVGGDYGFALDQQAETEQLLKDFSSGKNIKRDPIWAVTGFTEYSKTNDIGTTYVEVSISDQHLWYYKDGEKIVDCNVVTGNPYMGYSTPTGTFSLTYKQRGATLRGEEADGTEYESPVSYWMPFYGNYGMHDATWRYYFGGRIYLGGGSHGCVNMPFAAAEKVFNNIADSNVPVVIYSY